MKLREITHLLQRYVDKDRVLQHGFRDPIFDDRTERIVYRPDAEVTVRTLFDRARSTLLVEGATSDTWVTMSGPYDIDLVFQELFNELGEVPSLRLTNDRATHAIPLARQ